MKLISLTTAVTIALGGILAASPAMADKDDKSKGKGGKHDRGDQRDERHDDDRRLKDDKDRHSSGEKYHFEDRQYVVVREYYTVHYHGRSCPPGLTKKNNGCKPPGRAKKWRKGYPLPREVIFYTVPEPLVIQIGPPPSGHRYVRVAGDILMIAIGTGLVVDAIADLGTM